MLSRIKALFGKEKELQPECFTGVGVVLISDLCAARLLDAPLSPADLVEAMKEVLSFQTETIRRFGGVIDKYVGGCVVAYWPPKMMPEAVSAANSAALALVKKKGAGRVNFEMRVSFSAAAFSVAAFGPAGRQRIQLIGRAFERANSMQGKLPSGGILTDAETLLSLPESERVNFVMNDGYAFRLK